MKETIDKHQFKITIATAITTIIFIIALTAQVATFKAQAQAEHNEFDSRITHIGEKIVDMRADIDRLNTGANNRDVELAKINTKLANIEALLIDIRQDIRSHEEG